MNKKILMTMLTGVVLAANSAHAASMYVLNQSNALTDGVDYLQVTVSDNANGDVDFTVEVLDSLHDLAAGNFGIQSFAFNVFPGGDAEAGSITNLPDGWRARNSKRMDGFGLFDVKLQGRGWNRLETLTFSISDVEGDSAEDYAVLSTGKAGQGHEFFSARVAGFEWGECDGGCDDDEETTSLANAVRSHDMSDKGWEKLLKRDWKHDWDRNWDHDWYEDECVTSAFFGGSTNAVPLPGAAWLMLPAMAGVALRARRRKIT